MREKCQLKCAYKQYKMIKLSICAKKSKLNANLPLVVPIFDGCLYSGGNLRGRDICK